MRCRVTVQCGGPWSRSLALDGRAKERPGRADIALAAQAEVHGSARAIDRPVQVRPFAADLDVGLIDTPRRPDWPGEPVPAAFELRSIMVHPAHDGGVRQRQIAFRHHLYQVAIAELETQIPSHAQEDDLAVKMAALEQLIAGSAGGISPPAAHRTVRKPLDLHGSSQPFPGTSRCQATRKTSAPPDLSVCI